ncbi:MAG: recombinase family protein [Flavobacterium sp.]|uniref:recombinase family protein n=1 Tax=Flavobacterium sp. TaxID=239 RepID=UPI0022C5933B|nr:recombinase family protein [Flavobacterium sp.]
MDDSEKQSGEKISLLVVDDIDRIARDYGVHLEITNELKRRKIEYQSVKMKFENTSTGNFMEGTMALQAQFFRHQNKERVLSRQEARLLDGYRPRAYPVGYKTKSAPAGGRMLIKDEPRATYVAEALELYANDSLNSIREVRGYLKDR